MRNLFHCFAKKSAAVVGSAWAFTIAFVFVLSWIVTGPFLDYSNTWQLVINTGTTIITFLIVFLLQHTQNRDSESIQLKLDELIRVHKLAHKSVIDLEKLSDKQIKELEEKYNELSASPNNIYR